MSVFFLVFASCFSLSAQSGNSEYKIAQKIKLSGDGGWDYLSVDQIHNRMFVSHGSQVNVIDLNNFKLLASIKVTGQNPDAILYDPFTQRVFTFNGRSANSTVIDAKEYKVIGTIELSGKPEFPQSDGKGKVYVNIEDQSNITLINARTLKVENVWPIAPGEEPTGLALDDANHRLFSVCGNQLMTILSTETGKIISTVRIGSGCDGIAFDPVNKRIFSSNGEGTMTVVQQDDADNYHVVENLTTQPGARTITLDKNSHHLYLSVAEREEGGGRR